MVPVAFAQENADIEGEGSYFCENRDDEHPVAAGIAETYDLDYETVIAWFCGDDLDKDGENFGFGEIMLALQTSNLEDIDLDAEDILEMRADGLGWGEIWQEFGLIGKPDHAGPPAGIGRPDWAGPPEGVGPPDWAGPPEGVGPSEKDDSSEAEEANSVSGRPSRAGPPTGVGKP